MIVKNTGAGGSGAMASMISPTLASVTPPVRRVKVGANVPVFVLEFLLGKYCASSDELAIQVGLNVVNDTLAEFYIRADESMRAQS